MRHLRTCFLTLALLTIAATAACGGEDSSDDADVSLDGTTPTTEVSPDGDDEVAGDQDAIGEGSSDDGSGSVGDDGPPGEDGGIFGDGTWGHVELDEARYGAISRSCVQSEHEAGGASDAITFDLVDGQTKNSLELRLFTQNGTEYGAEFYRSDGELALSGTAEVSNEEADITFAEGTLDDGTPFIFELILAGACS